MSHLNFMDKLLDGYEVEWKPLGEVGEFIRGNGLQKKTLLTLAFQQSIMAKFIHGTD